MKKQNSLKVSLWLFLSFLILLYFLPTSLYAQAGVVKGIVKNENDQPIPGVSIMQKGANNATVSGNDGSFALSIPAGSILVFSHVGYAVREISVTGKDALNITLFVLESSMNDVVVIGYGRQQRKDLTGSVVSVSPGQIRDIPVGSVDQKLIGQVPGLQIGSPTGAPGGGTSIKIRGSGSIGAGDNPLFVVDGFPLSNTTGLGYNPLNMISPDDIESVTVLKDASSTAIYGSRGANGVIVITTRKGKSGIPVISANAYTGVQSIPMKGRPQVLNGTEYAQFQKDIIVDAFAARGQVATDNDIPAPYRNPAQYGKGTDWYQTVLQHGHMNNIDASISGGSENTRYSFSIGRLNQEGVIRYTDFQRYSIRTSVETSISKKFKVGISLAPSSMVQNRNDFNTGNRDVLTRALWLSPIIPVTDPTGKRTPYITSPGAIGAPNPLNSLQYTGTNSKNFRGLANAFAEYEIIPGLKGRYSFNVDYSTYNDFAFSPSFVGGESNPPPVVPNSNTNKGTTYNWLSEMLLSYDKSIGKDHQFNALVGYTAQKERAESIFLFADNYPDDRMQTINAATLISGYNQDVQKWSLISYLARLNYSFKGKYLFTATIRSDGSSRFGANKRYGTFPSAAIAWRASEENFLKDISWLSDLKLRASYGNSGNFNIGNYSYTSTIGSTNYSFGGQLANGRISTSLNNPNLTWEESKQFDAGVDISAYKGRITLNLDYYNRVTTAMLYNSEIPLSSGYSNATINSGKIQNRGVEIGLSSQVLDGSFRWRTHFNVAFSRNKALALNANNDPVYSGRSGEGNYTHKTEVGKPIGQFFGYVIEGIYKDQGDLDHSPKNASSVIGSIKYKDVDGNGIIEPVKDFAVIGNAQPKFTWGFTNNFRYGNFDLNVLLVGTQGAHELRTANQFLNNIDGVFNVDRKILNRWRSAANPGDGFTPTTNGARVIYRDVNSSWVENSSYMRIQNLTLGYSFSPAILKRSVFVKGFRLYASAQNLALFTNYKGSNPEAMTTDAGVLTPGEDFTNYPLPRIFTVGANVNF